MPSHLQENHGFKSQELSEQADYEDSDDIAEDRKLHWMINDLVLFVDNEDMPRLPRKLFEEVCQIRVAGAPGPVHQAMIEATQDFFKIMVFIFFVFVVVLTFGAVYRVSSTNQMLAALAGGFLPFIMKTFMAPNKPDIEIGTVSFKSRLDEIIKNFNQKWPIYDFPFEAWTEEDDKIQEEKEKGEKDGDDGDSAIATTDDATQKDVNENEPITETFHDAIDHATKGGRPFRNQNNNSGSRQLDNNIEMHPFMSDNLPFSDNVDVVAEEYISLPVEDSKPEMTKYDVDILVYLPDATKQGTDKWLAEWSDLDHYDDRDEHDFDEDEEEEDGDDDDTASVQSSYTKKKKSKSKSLLSIKINKK